MFSCFGGLDTRRFNIVALLVKISGIGVFSSQFLVRLTQ